MRRLIAAAIAAATLALAAPAAAATAAPSPWGYAPCTGVAAKARAFWGLPPIFDRIARRESKCIAWVRSGTRDTGLYQINDVNIPWLQRRIPWMPRTRAGAIAWLRDPYNNALAARLLYDLSGLRPWR
jgi:hypothetical protein